MRAFRLIRQETLTIFFERSRVRFFARYGVRDHKSRSGLAAGCAFVDAEPAIQFRSVTEAGRSTPARLIWVQCAKQDGGRAPATI
jgi:hypothetical protein